MESSTPLSAALLIGGRSRRMGTHKALLDRGGITLGDYLFELLENRFEGPPLVVGSGVLGLSARTFRQVCDRETGGGPLAAVLGLFDAGPNCDYLVMPVDMYAMNLAALNWLIDQRDHQRAVRPLLPGRPFGEPLPAIYNRTAQSLLETSWKRGERSLAAALPRQHVYEPLVPEIHRQAMTNVNSPEDLSALQQAMKDDLPIKSG